MNTLFVIGEIIDWILRFVGIYQFIDTYIKKK